VIGERPQMKLNGNRQGSRSNREKGPFFQLPRGVRGEVLGETAGIGDLPPGPLVPAKYFSVQLSNLINKQLCGAI
jgi:hypothetical protein